MATRDTDMITEKQRLIKKRKMDDIVCALETADRRELLENVIKMLAVVIINNGMLLSQNPRTACWNLC